MGYVSDHNFHVRKKDSLRTCFHFQQDCLRLTRCELVEQTPPDTASHHGSCHVTTETGSGMSVKECSKECLPFRKRKVMENEVADDMLCDEETELCCCKTENDPQSQQESCETNCTLEQKSQICEQMENNLAEETLTMPDSSNRGQGEDLCLHCDDSKGSQTTSSQMSETMADENNMHIYLGKCSLDSSNDASSSKSSEKLTFVAELSDIEYVNDIELNRQYCGVLESYLSKYRGEKLSLLYVTPRLSFLGIQAAKMGFSSVTIATAEEHQDTLLQVAAVNSCKPGVITVLDMSDLNDLEVKYDVVISDLVEPCGALTQQALEDLVYHRY